jgi:hypothetical protein
MAEKKIKYRERDVEAHLVKRVKEAGGIAYKFTSPQRRSVPDRLVLLDIAKAGAKLQDLLDVLCKSIGTYGTGILRFSYEEQEKQAAEIIAASMHFVETKATGEKPTVMQEREHTKLRAMGFTVKVIDNKDVIDEEYRHG